MPPLGPRRVAAGRAWWRLAQPDLPGRREPPRQGVAGGAVAKRQDHLQKLAQAGRPPRQTQAEAIPLAADQDILQVALAAGIGAHAELEPVVEGLDEVEALARRVPGFPAKDEVVQMGVGSGFPAVQAQQHRPPVLVEDKAQMAVLDQAAPAHGQQRDEGELGEFDAVEGDPHRVQHRRPLQRVAAVVDVANDGEGRIAFERARRPVDQGRNRSGHVAPGTDITVGAQPHDGARVLRPARHLVGSECSDRFVGCRFAHRTSGVRV